MAAGQGNSGYFELLSRGFDEEETSSYCESSEEEITDFSDDEIQVPPGENDSSSDDNISVNSIIAFDPNYKPIWSTTQPLFGVDRLNFTGEPGVNNDLVMSECFETMFTDELCKLIADMTNLFAERSMRGETSTPHSRMKRWTPIIMADVKIYAAIVLYQGILWKPTYEMYYTTDALFSTPGLKTVCVV